MDQDSGVEASADPAAAAFETLRREVVLLKVAIAGLAAEQPTMPDYSETLGEIAQGVRLAVGRMGRLATSPALALSPAQMAREITQAGETARRDDRATLHLAREQLRQAAGDLRGWIDSARLASVQSRRLLQVALAGLVGGAVLGISLPSLIAKAAPETWSWPEKRAARGLGRDLWSAGERLLSVADPPRWRQVQTDSALADDNRDAIDRCARNAGRTARPTRCVVLVKPHPPASHAQGVSERPASALLRPNRAAPRPKGAAPTGRRAAP